MNKREERKKQILSIALDEFVSKGYYGTSTREISKIAGISSGLMFHYFENKETLYHTLIAMGTDKMIFDIEIAKKDPQKYFTSVVEKIFEELKNNMFFAKMFLLIDAAQHITGIPEQTKKILVQADICHQCIPIMEIGQRMGQFREGDSRALCVAFFGAIQGIAQEKVRTPDTPLPEARWVMDIICM